MDRTLASFWQRLMTHVASPLRLRLRAACWLLGVLLLWPGLVLGQDAGVLDEQARAEVRAEAAAPRFFIETLTVEGLRRVSSSLVISEARLVAGREYSEAELHQAVNRIDRLPFILSAELALRKGTERGRYELVITVRESQRWFFGLNLRGYHFNRPLALDGSYSATSRVRIVPTVGLRTFVGSHGVLYGAYGGDAFLQAGYTQYNLFDRGMVASISLSRSLCCAVRTFSLGLDPSFSSWSLDGSRQLDLGFGLPLSSTESLQLSYQRTEADEGLRQEVLGGSFLGGLDLRRPRHQRLELSWQYNTTDDNLLPHSGTELSAGLFAASLSSAQSKFSFLTLSPEPRPSLDADQLGITASAVRYWPLTPRQSVSLGARASFGRSRVRGLDLDGAELPAAHLTSFEANVRAGYALSLWSAKKQRRTGGDLRFETAVELAYEGISPDPGLDAGTPLRRLDLSTGLVLRNRWGLYRFTFTYVDLEASR